MAIGDESYRCPRNYPLVMADMTPAGQPVGLCATCVHQKIIRSGRGSTFSMCLRSRQDPAFPKYPRLPVTACRGYEPQGPLGVSSTR
jgi:hypothetical protein